MSRLYIVTLVLIWISATGPDMAYAQSGIPGEKAAGKWDLTVEPREEPRPAWLEINTSGNSALTGRYVGSAGSVRPISEIEYVKDEETYRFEIPPQWSQRDTDPYFEFTIENDSLSGWTTDPDGNRIRFTGVRAPRLKPKRDKNRWSEPLTLLDQELSQWELPDNNRFRMRDGILVNEETGGNLITKEKFKDFKLYAEVRFPENGNSGIYLRGRYEVQITDDYGNQSNKHTTGGIYGFLEPTVNAARPAGEWQTYEVTLKGRNVTVELNGIEVISNRPIPGITGGALDSREGEPGPIMLQGDHGPVEFRNIIITEVD